MVFNRFVEIGRVVFVANGAHQGKLAVIVDVIDGNRTLVDGPCSDVPRGIMNFKDVQLTKMCMKLRPGQKTGKVEKAWKDENISKQWEESAWCKKLVSKQLRANMTDYDRFKLMKAKQMRNRLVRTEMAKLKKSEKTK